MDNRKVWMYVHAELRTLALTCSSTSSLVTQPSLACSAWTTFEVRSTNRSCRGATSLAGIAPARACMVERSRLAWGVRRRCRQMFRACVESAGTSSSSSTLDQRRVRVNHKNLREQSVNFCRRAVLGCTRRDIECYVRIESER
jgi:hypothetical protein